MKEELDIKSIESLVYKALENIYHPHIQRGSLLSENINKKFPDGSIINALKLILNPQYENTTFTWAQIKNALLDQKLN